jgi:tRNA A37 methylthiotransferase MiaB
LRLGPPVAREEAEERLQRLLRLQDEIQRELNEERVGAVEEVVVTGWGREAGWLSGRTPCHRIVHFPGGSRPARPGSILRVPITRALAHSLVGGEPLLGSGSGTVSGP